MPHPGSGHLGWVLGMPGSDLPGRELDPGSGSMNQISAMVRGAVLTKLAGGVIT